jgi:hypothetical protein
MEVQHTLSEEKAGYSFTENCRNQDKNLASSIKASATKIV